jgi:catechol 2,3-dioxygenase-like lactoylglutathione lyase family enzyme
MGMLRFDHLGVVVDDLDAVQAFFLDLGFEREGGTLVEGEVVDRINGLDGVRADVVMVRTPDRTGKLELVKYHAPVDDTGAQVLPPNRPGFRHIAIEVDDLGAVVDQLREKGFDTVGEVADYGNVYRLVYVRGPEGLIVEFAQALGRGGDHSTDDLTGDGTS